MSFALYTKYRILSLKSFRNIFLHLPNQGKQLCTHPFYSRTAPQHPVSEDLGGKKAPLSEFEFLSSSLEVRSLGETLSVSQ